MKSAKITVSLGSHTATAEFHKSEDCGYSAGRLLLDLPGGDTISISRDGRKYLQTRIQNGIARSCVAHNTKSAALNSAAMEFAAESCV